MGTFVVTIPHGRESLPLTAPKPTMDEVTEAPLLKRAHGAAADGDWRQAYELFVQADACQPLEPTDLAVFANCAYAAGHVDATIDAWERVHAQGLRAGDHLMAAGAAVRVALHLLFDTALLAPIRGWASRAERLLAGQKDTPVHAWIAVVRSYERLLSGDFGRAREWARRAIDVGTGRDPAAAALGRIAEARSLILEGEVTRGLDLLNEAAVATMSGELDPLSTGVVYCEVVCALQAVAQYDLAEQWTQAMERWRQGQPVGSIHGRCRVHRAEILRLRGSCSEAEQEALGACEELRPYLRREFGWPLTELGRIRLHTGDIRGAEEAFLAAHQAGWDPQPGLALVRLAQGDVPLAAALIREALDYPLNVPSKELPPNSDLRRAPLLAAQVEIEIAAGDIDRARQQPTSSRAWRQSSRARRSRPAPSSRADRYDWPLATWRRPEAISRPPSISGEKSARPTKPDSDEWGLRTHIVPKGMRHTPSWSSERLTPHLNGSAPSLRRLERRTPWARGHETQSERRRHRRVRLWPAVRTKMLTMSSGAKVITGCWPSRDRLYACEI